MDRWLSDAWLIFLGACFLAMSLILGCLGDKPKIEQGAGDDVGQKIVGIEAQAKINADKVTGVEAKIDKLSLDTKTMNGNRAGQIKAMRDAVQSSIQNNGMSTWGLIVKDVVQGLLVVVLVYLLLRRQVNRAVCKWYESRAERRIHPGPPATQ